jgi:hypothetical protein
LTLRDTPRKMAASFTNIQPCVHPHGSYRVVTRPGRCDSTEDSPGTRPGGGEEGIRMDDVNRFARELADAIAAVVSDHPKVDACRERARAAGYEMRVTLEAVVGFVSRDKDKDKEKDKDKLALAPGKAAPRLTPAQAFEITTNDRRFLRSLRIAADETTEEVN